ncbi:esterase/lipase family protein [Bradyrhizobium sp. USDA 4529]
MSAVFPDLVIVIPGLIGSVLEKDGRAVWGYTLGAAWRVVAGNALDLLELKGADDERDDLGDGIKTTGMISDVQLIPGLWKLEGYSILAEKLVGDMKLIRNENYREFPYDWRRSNRVSAKKLAALAPEWLREWREKSGNAQAKVTFVVHSMGGLVARYYIECLGGWKTTRTLLSFGTPYRGSGNALGYICNGFSWDVGPLKTFDGTKAIRSFDSVYQLLPTYPFVDVGSKDLARIGDLALPNLDRRRASAAAAFHHEIESAQAANAKDEAYAMSGPKVRPVVGIEQPTLQSAKFDGTALAMLRSLGGRDLKGDGTVPRPSAIPVELAQQSASYVATTHSALQSDHGALGHVRGVLTEADIDLSKFREVGVGTLGLDLQDAYAADKTVEISAIPSDYVQSIPGRITRLDAAQQETTITLRPTGGDRYVGSVKLPTGLYRVNFAEVGFHPVSDVFLVLEE